MIKSSDINWIDGYEYWACTEFGSMPKFYKEKPILRDGYWEGYWENDENPPDTTGTVWTESLVKREVVEVDEFSPYPEPYQEQPTLRDQFAMAALPAIIQSNRIGPMEDWADDPKQIAKETYEIADAVLKQREKEDE